MFRELGSYILWPFIRSATRAPTIKAIREIVASKGIFDN